MAPVEEEVVQEKALKLDGSWPEHQPRLEALSSHEVLRDLRAAGCHWEAEAGWSCILDIRAGNFQHLVVWPRPDPDGCLQSPLGFLQDLVGENRLEL